LFSFPGNCQNQEAQLGFLVAGHAPAIAAGAGFATPLHLFKDLLRPFAGNCQTSPTRIRQLPYAFCRRAV
jgi:hypothetical protein